MLDSDGNCLVTKLLDLLVADFVVSLVGVSSFTFGDVASFNVSFDELGDLHLGEVHRLVADVVSLSLHRSVVLDGVEESPCNILDVKEGSLEVGLIKIEGLHGARLVEKIVDEEIDSESWGGSEDGGKSKSNAVSLLEDGGLTSLLGLTVEGDGVAGSVLSADAFNDTVAGASRSVDDSLVGLEPFAKLFDAGLVQGSGELGLFLAGRVANNGGEMDDDVVAFDQGFVSGSVEDVTFDDGKIGVVENTKKGSRSPSEDIVNGDLVSLLEVKGDHGGTEVTSTAGNEDGFNVLIVSWDSHF